MFIPHLPPQTVMSKCFRERHPGQCVLTRPLREPAPSHDCSGWVVLWPSVFPVPTCSPILPCGFWHAGWRRTFALPDTVKARSLSRVPSGFYDLFCFPACGLWQGLPWDDGGPGKWGSESRPWQGGWISHNRLPIFRWRAERPKARHPSFPSRPASAESTVHSRCWALPWRIPPGQCPALVMCWLQVPWSLPKSFSHRPVCPLKVGSPSGSLHTCDHCLSTAFPLLLGGNSPSFWHETSGVCFLWLL